MSNFHNECLICGGAKLSVVSKFERAHLTSCIKCGFIFSKMKPTADDLQSYYSDYPRAESLSAITKKRYSDLLDEFEKFRSNNRILDIGCGNGLFLSEAKARGWEVYGTEYVINIVDKCKAKGIKMHLGELNSDSFENGFFDVITLFEVIEHINNPLEEVQYIDTFLRTNGLFYFTTPNFNSISRQISGSNWNIVEYPEHLSYYTPTSINNLFLNSSLKIHKLKTTGISLTRYNESKENLTHNSENKDYDKDEILRSKIERNWYLKLLKKIINQGLTFLGIGDSIKAYLIKIK
ncbi:MAG: class I SAM-dependent methyltransferase [Bacteroidota bacterium]|nr:class I SAM-dependent methyltransferase [Bacteroidota bacterium]